MDVKKLIADVSRPDWGGHPVSSLRPHLIEVYELLSWFFEKTTDEYLNQDEKSVVKSIKKDNPPKVFREILLKVEVEDKNRKNVVNALKG